MSDHFIKSLEDIREMVSEKEAEIVSLKGTANQLSALLGIDAPYPDVTGTTATVVTGIRARAALSFRPDQFFGKSLSGAVSEYLSARKDANPDDAPASVDQIFDALKQGGFRFDTSSDDNSRRAIKISLTKTTALFVRVADGIFGLKKWYGGIRSPRKSVGSAGDKEQVDSINESDTKSAADDVVSEDDEKTE